MIGKGEKGKREGERGGGEGEGEERETNNSWC